MGWVMCKIVETRCDTIQAGDADRQMERERRWSEEVDPCSTVPTANPD